jgi:hypothetical protein
MTLALVGHIGMGQRLSLANMDLCTSHAHQRSSTYRSASRSEQLMSVGDVNLMRGGKEGRESALFVLDRRLERVTPPRLVLWPVRETEALELSLQAT